MSGLNSIVHAWTEGRKNAFSNLGLSPARKLNIYLARHIKTEANADPTIHQTKPDKAIQVIPEERQGGESAAQFLMSRLFKEYQASPRRFGAILVIYSPYDRTQDTTIPYLYYLGEKFGRDRNRILYRQDDRLIELRTGLRDGMRGETYAQAFPEAAANFSKHEKHNATSYALSPMGESYIDLAWRARQTHPSILSDYEDRQVRHCLIIAHGGTNRAFVQGWMNYTPQWIVSEQNPDNNWIRHLRGIPRRGLVVDPEDFTDHGYIYGLHAPLGKPSATQNVVANAEDSFVLQSQRPGDVVPPGTKVINPFEQPRRL